MAEEVKPLLVDPWSIINHPLLTEKGIGKIESENKLIFIVKRKSTKKQVKWAVEKLLEVKVDDVNTLIDEKGRKKAFVKLNKEFNASDIATRFGML
jgi:ribosomal protein uL23